MPMAEYKDSENYIPLRKSDLVHLLSRDQGLTLEFFFSSRRRHTRLQGDWSSDVCSSDLGWDSPAEFSARTRAGGPPWPVGNSKLANSRSGSRASSCQVPEDGWKFPPQRPGYRRVHHTTEAKGTRRKCDRSGSSPARRPRPGRVIRAPGFCPSLRDGRFAA